ncbi:unnamed protein product, partial [Rangifer tarandus platyrhynchus]
MVHSLSPQAPRVHVALSGAALPGHKPCLPPPTAPKSVLFPFRPRAAGRRLMEWEEVGTSGLWLFLAPGFSPSSSRPPRGRPCGGLLRGRAEGQSGAGPGDSQQPCCAVWVACPMNPRPDLPAPPGAQLQAWVAASARRGRGVQRPRFLSRSAPTSHAIQPGPGHRPSRQSPRTAVPLG